MLRGVGLFQPEPLDQFPGGKFSVAEHFHNGDPGRVGETLERYRL